MYKRLKQITICILFLIVLTTMVYAYPSTCSTTESDYVGVNLTGQPPTNYTIARRTIIDFPDTFDNYSTFTMYVEDVKFVGTADSGNRFESISDSNTLYDYMFIYEGFRGNNGVETATIDKSSLSYKFYNLTIQYDGTGNVIFKVQNATGNIDTRTIPSKASSIQKFTYYPADSGVTDIQFSGAFVWNGTACPSGVDATPPTLSVTYPANASIITTTNIGVEGTCTDASGISQVWLNGASSFTNATASPFNMTATLLDGNHYDTEIFCNDTAGNTASYNLSFDISLTCTNFTVTANDIFANSLSSFTANITYNGTTTSFNDVGGTVTTPYCAENELLANVVIDKTNWFAETYTNINTSSSYNATNLYQATMNVYASEIITGNSLSSFNVYLEIINDTTTGTFTSFNLTSGLYNITLEKTGYYNRTILDYSLDALDTDNVNMSNMYDALLTIEDTDDYTKANIGTYLTEIVRGSFTNTTSTTTGSVTFELLSGLTYNITTQPPNYFSYLNYDYALSSGATTINATVFQAEIIVMASEIISGNQLSGFSIYFGDINQTTATDSTLLNISAGTYNITVEKTGYYNRTWTDYTISALTNTTYNVTDLYTALLTVDATDLTGADISSFVSNITGTNYTYYNSSSSSSSLVIFELIYGDYGISVIAGGTYNTNNGNVAIYSNAVTYNASLYQENTLNFSFYDIETMLPVNDRNVTIELIGSYNSYNMTTETGTLSIEVVTPDYYTIRYSDAGYDVPDEYVESFYAFYLINDTVNHITLYMVNSSDTTTIKVIVYDEATWQVENAEVKVLRYDHATNLYLTQEILPPTDSNGETFAHLTVGTEFYKFIVIYPYSELGEIKLETVPAYIQSGTTEIALQINTQNSVLEQFYDTALNIDYTLTFDDTNDRFRFMYNDGNNLITDACMYVYRTRWDSTELLNFTCGGTTSGILYVSVDNVTDYLYKADTFVYYNTVDENYIASLVYGFHQANSFGKFGLFMTLIILIVIVFITAWNPVLLCFVAPLSFVLTRAIGIIDLSWGTIGAIYTVSIFIGIYISRHG